MLVTWSLGRAAWFTPLERIVCEMLYSGSRKAPRPPHALVDAHLTKAHFGLEALTPLTAQMGFPEDASGKEPSCQREDIRDTSLTPESGKS